MFYHAYNVPKVLKQCGSLSSYDELFVYMCNVLYVLNYGSF